MDQQPGEVWGNVEQACAFWQVSRRTIYNWLSHGKIKTRRTPGGILRIKLEFNDTSTKPSIAKNPAPGTCARCGKTADEHLLVNYSTTGQNGEEPEQGDQGLVCPTAQFLEK